MQLLKNEIQSAEVELVATLATAPATVEQLLSFKPGDFVELDLEPVIQAKVDGVPVFDCHYGTSNKHYSHQDRSTADRLRPRVGWENRHMSAEQHRHERPRPHGRRLGRRANANPGTGNEVASEVANAAESVAPATFTNFAPTATAGQGAGNDINMILDIPVQLTVELGRTRIPIKHILQLAQGSVVELDALAGEPMDVLVNGYLIAQGEVVVVNDKFGIRLTDIVTPSERCAG